MEATLEQLSALESIRSLQQDWGLWRDTSQWDKLRGSFTVDANIITTWYDGSARGFVDASIKMSGGRSRAQHFVGGSTIELKGDKALVETRVVLLVRGFLNDVEVDAVCYGRFYDQVVVENGVWKIKDRVPIYEKDSICAVNPSQPLVLDPAELARYPAPYRHLAYLQASGGAAITMTIPLPNSDGQASLYEAGQRWLAA